MFWRDLADDFYDEKDIFGNRDLKLAQKCNEDVDQVLKRLGLIPSYYREFYRLRILERLRPPVLHSS